MTKMEKEKNMIDQTKYFFMKVNLKMEKGMEKEKNIILEISI